ncbi:MAG: DUF255 domain-containing protein [Bdellovibrionota bacterium]
MFYRTKSFATLIISAFMFTSSIAHADAISWQHALDETTFTKAKKENRLVILDLEAVWCHWCHVMEEQTYSKPDIQKLIGERYIAVRIDQDARPDLGNRYRDYGWPATIIFNSSGEELDKLSGFVEPQQMAKLLADYAEHPTPKEKPTSIQYSERTSLSDELKAELVRRFEQTADRELGGLTTSHKYLDPDTLEYALKRATEGDQPSVDFVKKSLTANLQLLDPAWGGVYQYSTHGNWENPHFEKIAPKQAADLRTYALAYAVWRDEQSLKAMQSIRKYLDGFLHDAGGAFYTSQDADLVQGEHSAEFFQLSDGERRKRGIPRIDKNIYASENGKIISALAAVYASTQDTTALEQARKAAEWVQGNRALPGGGFKHGDADPAGPYLCDTLFMGRALLDLYAVTGERKWLVGAEQAAQYIQTTFAPAEGTAGYPTSFARGAALKPLPVLSENVTLVRFLALLTNYTGKPEYKTSAEAAMRYLATKEVATESITEPGILLADNELNVPPLHIVTVAPKDDAVGKSLFAASLSYAASYKRTEWWDRREGQMPNPDVQYPVLPKPAAFVCTNKRCSLPIFKPDDIPTTIKKLTATAGS